MKQKKLSGKKTKKKLLYVALILAILIFLESVSAIFFEVNPKAYFYSEDKQKFSFTIRNLREVSELELFIPDCWKSENQPECSERHFPQLEKIKVKKGEAESCNYNEEKGKIKCFDIEGDNHEKFELVIEFKNNLFFERQEDTWEGFTKSNEKIHSFKIKTSNFVPKVFLVGSSILKSLGEDIKILAKPVRINKLQSKPDKVFLVLKKDSEKKEFEMEKTKILKTNFFKKVLSPAEIGNGVFHFKAKSCIFSYCDETNEKTLIVDTENPVITTEKKDYGTITDLNHFSVKAVVSDNIGLSNISFRFNRNEFKEYDFDESQKNVEVELKADETELLEGENSVSFVAVDWVGRTVSEIDSISFVYKPEKKEENILKEGTENKETVTDQNTSKTIEIQNNEVMQSDSNELNSNIVLDENEFTQTEENLVLEQIMPKPVFLKAFFALNSVFLKWSEPDSFDYFELAKSFSSSGKKVLIYKGKQNFFSDNSIEYGKKYFYWVRFKQGKSFSPWSDMQDVVTPAKNNPPVIKEFFVEKPEITESEPAKFVVKAYDIESKKLEYFFDFGDGTKIISNSPEIEHSYFLEDLTKNEKFFTVRVTVSDLKGGKTYKKVRIKVLRSLLKIQVLQPNMLKEIERNTQKKVIVSVKDIDNQPFNASHLKEFYVLFNKKRVPLHSTDDAGILEGGLNVSLFEPENSILEIFVKSMPVEENPRYSKELIAKSILPVGIKPEQIFAENPFYKKKFFLGNTLKNLELKLFYENKQKVDANNFVGNSFIVFQGTRFPAPIRKKGNKLFIDSNFHLLEKHLGKKINLTITGKDVFGNILKETSFPVIIDTENPDFQLLTTIEGLLPDKQFGYTQKVRIKAKIQGKLKDKPLVELFLPELNIKKLFELELFSFNKAVYSASFEMPSNNDFPLNYVTYKVIAKMPSENPESIAIFKDKLFLTDKLNVKIIYPDKNNENPLTQDNNKVIVSITFPNGEIVSLKKFPALLTVNGEKKKVVFKKTGDNKYFETQLEKSFLKGENTLEIDLAGKLEGEQNSTVYFSVPESETQKILIQETAKNIFLSGIVLIAVYLVFFIISSNTARIKKLREKQESIYSYLKNLRLEYYKRRVSEKEYKEKALEKQQELAIVKKKLEKLESKNIKILKKEIGGIVAGKKIFSFSVLLKKFFYNIFYSRKTSPKIKKESIDKMLEKIKESERGMAKKIIRELLPRTNEFSRFEVYSALTEQKFSNETAKIIAEILYGKPKIKR